MKFKFNHPDPSDDTVVGPKYWKSLDEVAGSPEFDEWLHREFPQGASELDGVNRRHFMKIMAASFAFAGLGLAGCRQPERKILPYAKQPERNIPGIATFYTSSMPSAEGNIPLIVETHGSRPTKIEGNPSYLPYGGGTDIFSQASILDLYDQDRLGESVNATSGAQSKAQILDLLSKTLELYKDSGGEGLAFLAEHSTSPSRERMVAMLKEKFPNATWAEFEPTVYTNRQKALKDLLGQNVKPLYKLDKASRILALDSDFLHAGTAHMADSRNFAKARRVKNSSEASKMNRLYAAESYFTLTGAMADHRLRVASSHIPALASLFAATILRKTGNNAQLADLLEKKAAGLDLNKEWVEQCAQDLVDNQGKSLVIAGDHLPEEVHTMAFIINDALQSAGNTLSYVETSDSEAASIQELAKEIQSGKVNTLFVLGGNPVYNAPADLDWKSLQSSVNTIHLSYHANETATAANTVIAQSHYLETWSDGRTHDGAYVPVQPMILPLFETFSENEVLAHLLGLEDKDPYAFVQATFKEVAPSGNFDAWLAKGVAEGTEYEELTPSLDASKAFNTLAKANFNSKELSIENLEVRFLPSNQVGDGRYNNNGWLQECPDPMTKLTWDNAISVSPRLARELEKKFSCQLLPDQKVMNKIDQLNLDANKFKRGREEALVGEITVNGKTVRGPIHVQPGLANYTLAVTVGYGRQDVGRVGQGTGFDVYPLIASTDNAYAVGASLNVLDEGYQLANTQEHWSMEGRAILREGNVKDYEKDSDFVQKMGMESHSPNIYGISKDLSPQEKSTQIPRGGGMFQTPEFPGKQQWGMAIDLNTCSGCNACVVACQSENNIPIVGKDQVLRGREMHWLRLDRYYSSGTTDGAELPEDPQVSFMGMGCQHCEMAPCEMVCPVNATVHDEEGLNTMAYNRCVGTRYCANNCPYKVRRFNFFDWNKREIGHFYEGPLGPSGVPELEKMQKNPDVTVRMRGVMEKCTYCVQRIEEAKISQRVIAKDSPDVDVPDGTIKTACQQVCPSDSIVFGDINDPSTEVSKAKESDRNYSALGYLNVRPRTTYLAKLRNPNPAMPDYHDYALSYKEYKKRNGHGDHGAHDSHDEHTAHHSAAASHHHHS